MTDERNSKMVNLNRTLDAQPAVYARSMRIHLWEEELDKLGLLPGQPVAGDLVNFKCIGRVLHSHGGGVADANTVIQIEQMEMEENDAAMTFKHPLIGITWVDEEYDEKLGAAQRPLSADATSQVACKSDSSGHPSPAAPRNSVVLLGAKRDTVSSVNGTAQVISVKVHDHDSILASIEADLALVMGRGLIVSDRLKGVDKSTWSDLKQDIAFAFLESLLQIQDAVRRLAQLRFELSKGL